jgi:hypothetical protein
VLRHLGSDPTDDQPRLPAGVLAERADIVITTARGVASA